LIPFPASRLLSLALVPVLCAGVRGDFMSEEMISASDELEYVRDLMADLELSPSDSLQSLIDALEAETEDEDEE
jgi:hypothetical protein